jgi:hypothetical protein
MNKLTDEMTRGVKTFFVTPDSSLVSEDFLEDFFMNGYETYFLDDDQNCKLEWKIDALFETFDQIILFFNLNRKVQGIPRWSEFIAKLQTKYKERALIGVTYLKTSPEEAAKLQRLYLFDIGIVCGCIQLEYNRNKNYQILNTVLMVNQANGLRKNLRAICGNNCKLDMVIDEKNVRGTLRDVSISHFSCVFNPGMNQLSQWAKVDDIMMNLHGIIIKTSAVLCLQRKLGNEMINVFVFRNSEGKDGLDPILRAKVNKYVFTEIYEIIQDYLTKRFTAISMERRR